MRGRGAPGSRVPGVPMFASSDPYKAAPRFNWMPLLGMIPLEILNIRLKSNNQSSLSSHRKLPVYRLKI